MSKVLQSVARILALVAMLLTAPAAAYAHQQAVPVGAIRWDDWSPGSPDIALLQQPQWAARIPFFAHNAPQGGLLLHGAQEHVLAAEAAYARAGGLDYFVFGFYPESGSWGRSPRRHLGLNRALVSFLRLPDRAGMRFAVSLNQSFPDPEFADIGETLGDLVAHPDYLRTPAGAAPVFLFGHEPESWSRALGTPERFRQAFSRMREAIRRRTGVEILAVFLHADPSRGATLARALGMDMVSAYVVPAGSGGRGIPYAECMARMRAHWRGLADTGLPMLPNVTVGWDYRPRTEAKGQRVDAPGSANWCAPPTAAELGSAVREALDVASRPATQDFRSVLIYAWNEYTEGGWLAPTRSEGVARLEALRTVLGHDRAGPVTVELSWPEYGMAAPACPLRSTERARDAVLAACTPSEIVAPWPCPPGMRPVRDGLRAPSGLEALLHDGAWAIRHCERAQ